jgi:cation diffusion facilitator family transporter
VVEKARINSAKPIHIQVLRISLVAIVSVVIFEFCAGIIANSLSLITDGAHALLDAAITGILLIAARLALKPRDVEHTYGHGKIETVGGFIGGVALFILAIFVIYEALARITIGVADSSLVKPGMLGFAAVIYTLSVDGFRLALLQYATKRAESITLKADYYHAFTDLLSTGIVLLGLWLVTVGFNNGDSIAAIVLGVFLAYLSFTFSYRSALDLTDTISPKLVLKVNEAAYNTSGVLECKDVKMRRVGRETFIDAIIILRANMSFENAHNISAEVEKNISESIGGNPNIVIHFEPIWSSDLPLESIIETAALNIKGVKGIHNILVSRADAGQVINVSVHIQVDRFTKLIDAHSIANLVEDSVKKNIRAVQHVVVHLEPLMPGVQELRIIKDKPMEESIKSIISRRLDIKHIGSIIIYKTNEDILKIDINCVFQTSGETIEEIHEKVSQLERDIRTRYPNAIVTIHAEPS